MPKKMTPLRVKTSKTSKLTKTSPVRKKWKARSLARKARKHTDAKLVGGIAGGAALGAAEAYAAEGTEGLRADTKAAGVFTAIASAASRNPKALALGRGIMTRLGLPAFSLIGAMDAGTAVAQAKEIITEDIPKMRREQVAMQKRYGTMARAAQNRVKVQARNKLKMDRIKEVTEKGKGILEIHPEMQQYLSNKDVWESHEDMPEWLHYGYAAHLENKEYEKDFPLKEEYPGVYKK